MVTWDQVLAVYRDQVHAMYVKSVILHCKQHEQRTKVFETIYKEPSFRVTLAEASCLLLKQKMGIRVKFGDSLELSHLAHH